ncbi:MAG: transcriptional repressor [Acidimicrobiaceae bacterium]|nr:transcriptional repressor [Acidimicrobiaceae bacterium]
MARPARTKEKLIDLIDDLEYHEWTIDQLHAELGSRGWDVTYSSVFRALNQLEEDGFVRKLASESDKVVFEKNIDHHEHLKCETCGGFVSLDCVLGDELAKTIHSATGFVVRSHFFSGSGVCRNCASRADD